MHKSSLHCSKQSYLNVYDINYVLHSFCFLLFYLNFRYIIYIYLIINFSLSTGVIYDDLPDGACFRRPPPPLSIDSDSTYSLSSSPCDTVPPPSPYATPYCENSCSTDSNKDSPIHIYATPEGSPSVEAMVNLPHLLPRNMSTLQYPDKLLLSGIHDITTSPPPNRSSTTLPCQPTPALSTRSPHKFPQTLPNLGAQTQQQQQQLNQVPTTITSTFFTDPPKSFKVPNNSVMTNILVSVCHCLCWS